MSHLIDDIICQRQVWQSLAPFYYDVYMHQFIPSIPFTFEWIPSIKKSSGLLEQCFVCGEIASNGKSCLKVFKAFLPTEETLITPTDYQDGMIGDYAVPEGDYKCRLIKNIPHEGDANKCRYLPDSTNVITLSSNKCVYNTNLISNQKILVGKQEDNGFGLSCCCYSPNKCVTSCNNGDCYIWDVEKKALQQQYTISKDIYVNDANWSSTQELIATTTEGGYIVLIDPRVKKIIQKFHLDDGTALNCCDFSPFLSHMFITGGVNGNISIWDLRQLQPMFTIKSHNDIINGCQCSPFQSNVIMSYSVDQTVHIHDLSKLGSGDDLEFVHSGHNSQVNDSRWNPNLPFFIGSVAEEYNFQLWKYNEDSNNN
ncbi:Histone acetyltransferase type B subunit [Entamoeba marina]